VPIPPLPVRRMGQPRLNRSVGPTRAPLAEDTDWVRIASLYGDLVALTRSPIVELNRAVAVSMADGPAAGLAVIDRLLDVAALRGYHLLPSVCDGLLGPSSQVDRSAATPSWSAAARRRRSRVHSRSRELSRNAAKRWASTELKPTPCRACSSTNASTSAWVAVGVLGRSDSKRRIVVRSRRDPSASSPMIIGWVDTCASFRRADSAASER
jgi:hypothetical protein